MQKLLLCFILVSATLFAFSQPAYDPEKISSEYFKAYKALAQNPGRNVNTTGKEALSLLLQMEYPNRYYEGLSPATRRLISTRFYGNSDSLARDAYALVLIERAVEECDSLTNLSLKEKLLVALSKEINLLMKDQYPYYNYNTKKKQLVKFVSIRTGNDLFTLAGLFSNLVHSPGKLREKESRIFQPNLDRDYTGSFLLEVGTDYLNTLRKRPIKTYQTLLYGFEVFTPYYRDTVKVFVHDTSYNPLDRPHATFQYVGWSKKGISRNDKYRWSTTIKIGKIGGDIGEKFQNVIHQDISYSPRPKGWRAQIADGGRVGVSIEFREEFGQVELLKSNARRNHFLSFFSEQKVGTYMTNATAGIKLGNRSFRENNMNFINHRIRQTVYNLWEHLMYQVSFSATGVLHNTMLEGYGIFNTKESENDVLTPASRYYLQPHQVRRVIFTLNTTVSYTTRFATFFYNWYSFSPETKMGKIGIASPVTGKEMDISKRWLHFAELGFVFNVH